LDGRGQLGDYTGFCLSCAKKFNDGNWGEAYILWTAPDCGYPGVYQTNTFRYIERK
jgi:hypothetical protein